MGQEKAGGDGGGRGGAERADPEVVAKAQRRRFSAAYKLRIVLEADKLIASGEGVGSLLRTEGLYSSHLSDWRKARDEGLLEALAPKKRGRKPDADAESKKELARLKRENERLQNELTRAALIIDVQKKLSRLLGLAETS